MGLDLDYIDGQTPLDEEEKEGLLIPTIATRGEFRKTDKNIGVDKFLVGVLPTFPAKAIPEQPTSKPLKLPIRAITVCCWLLPGHR
jgi:hypothetical protein